MNLRANTAGSGVSDAELVRAAQRGDKRAFVEIVTRHQAMVCGVALGILGDFAAGEDAGQEAFLTAWQKIHELRDPDRLRGWLGQIARNAALGYRRRTREHASLEQAPNQADEAPLPDEAAATEEEAMLVRDSLAKLPETYRLPLILFYREGQSVRAVAEVLDISEDAVKQRLARGRELLRERMSGLIETVLARTTPNGVFTMTIAVAIGALMAPAIAAGSVFSAASAVSASAASGSSSSLSTFLTAMSTSKAFLVVTALVSVVCIPLGYQWSAGNEPRARGPVMAPVEVAVAPRPAAAAPVFENSALFAEWRELHEQHGTNAQSMPVLYRAIANLKDPFRRRAFRSALIAEWVQVDPAGGLEFFLGKGPDDAQRQSFLQEWLASNASAAVEALLARGPGWEETARECLPEIARRLPSRLAEVASRLLAPESYWDTNVRDAFAILAGRGLAEARQAAGRVTGPSRDQALGGVAQAWARSDLEGAVAWARGLPEGTDRDEVIRVALLGKASIDPTTALDQAGIVPSGGRHAHSSSTTGARILIEAAKSDFDTTVSWLVAHPGRFGREDLMGLSTAVTERLNAGAVAFLKGRVEDGSLGALLPAIESALLNSASGQRAAVWDWLKNQPVTETTKLLRMNVLRFAGYQDPDLALRLATELPRTPEGNTQMQELARSLLNGGNQLYRFDALYPNAPERLKQPFLEAAFQYLGRENMDDPHRWIDRVPLLPDASRASAVASVARAWAQQSPEEAISWSRSLAGETRNGAVGAIAAAWAATDVPGATEWLTAMPPGADRDRGAGSLVTAIAERYPQEAWAWALSIQDPAERTRAATLAARTMGTRDLAMARQWIETGPFTPELKAELQSTVGQPVRRGAR